jgi:hypothetical protein
MVQGEDNYIYHNVWNVSGWQGWTRLPSGFTLDSLAATANSGMLRVVVRGMAGNALWFASIDLDTEAFSG